MSAFVGPDGREHEAEVGGTHQHGNDKDDFNGDVVVESDTDVFCAETASATGRHGQGDGIEPWYISDFQCNG